ncbi:unnamed protein product [Merluccius merluccius]
MSLLAHTSICVPADARWEQRAGHFEQLETVRRGHRDQPGENQMDERRDRTGLTLRRTRRAGAERHEAFMASCLSPSPYTVPLSSRSSLTRDGGDRESSSWRPEVDIETLDV